MSIINDEEDDDFTYVVVKNHEEQYSIWPDFKMIPAGWEEVNQRGSKKDCLSYISEVWTDMRPRSLREAMEKDNSNKDN